MSQENWLSTLTTSGMHLEIYTSRIAAGNFRSFEESLARSRVTRRLQHYLLRWLLERAKIARTGARFVKPVKKQKIDIDSCRCILVFLCTRRFSTNRSEEPRYPGLTSSTLWIFVPCLFFFFFYGILEYAPISVVAASSRERVGVVIFCASGFQRARPQRDIPYYTGVS